MPETSPGLPPVGELVQITHRDGNPWVPDEERPVLVKLGHLDNEGVWWTVRDGDISSVDVISWCRVLVLADTDDALVDLIGCAIAGTEGYTPEQWAGFREGNPSWLRSRPAYKMAEAAVAALREAAIR